MDLLLRRYLKLKSAGVGEDITQQYIFFLRVHKCNCFLSLIQDSSVMHNPVSSPPQSLIFLSTLQLQAVRSFSAPLLYSASDNPAVRVPSHLPASQFCILPHFPSCPSLPVSSCHSPSDGIIPVILSHYRSSDANGCTANPAAGKAGPVPIPALPGSVTAVPCSVMPVMRQESQAPGSQAGGGWEDWMLKWALQGRAGGPEIWFGLQEKICAGQEGE